MDKNFTNNNSSKYAWNDAMILDKVQEILGCNNIDDLDFNEETLENLKARLNENISLEEINESAYLVAQNIDELKVCPDEEIKDYILKLKNYLDSTNVTLIKGEFKGIEFDVHGDSSIEDVFKEYYSKYDDIYGISEMLSDLGLK